MLGIDTNIPPIYAKSISEFNNYVEKYARPNAIILTKSGNISQQTMQHMPCSLTWKRQNHMEFHVIDPLDGELLSIPQTEECFGHLRVIYALHYDESAEITSNISYKAYNYFNSLIPNQRLIDIIPDDDNEEDIDMFVCPQNPKSAYYNYVNPQFLDVEIEHCYSLDRNNSFPASMMEIYPITGMWVRQYYEDRLEMKRALAKAFNYQTKEYEKLKKEYAEFKLYGSIFVGWLNNPKTHHKRAWKKIVSNSNEKVHELRMKIEKAGNTVLLVNTDAVKFIGHYDYEGSENLGEFKYEWKDANMYIKGVKSYAYKVAGDRWKFKQAGKCNLDDIKPRDLWTLEDFVFGATNKIKKIIIKENNQLEEIEEDGAI